MYALKISGKEFVFICGVKIWKCEKMYLFNLFKMHCLTLTGQLGDRIAYKQGLWTVIVPASSHCSALQGMCVGRRQWTMKNDMRGKKQTDKKIKVKRHFCIYALTDSVTLKWQRYGRKKSPQKLRFTVMADCTRIGNKAKPYSHRQAQFASTFSNRVFYPVGLKVRGFGGGKYKFHLSSFQCGYFRIFPCVGRMLN